MSKTILSCCLLLGLWLPGQAQETAVVPSTDTTVYLVAEQMPRFPGCEALDTTLAVKQQCAQASLLNFIYQNVRYPEAARLDGVQGTVVLTFVVETDGSISNLETIRDIGAGCGEEAMRVVGAMNEVGIRWVPGMTDGKPVRVRYNIPIKFKLEEPLPYVLVGADSIYVEFDSMGWLAYEGGDAALQVFLEENLKYPAMDTDSCYIGEMDLKLLVRADGSVDVIEISDFNDLGFDFQFEAIQLAIQTSGKWIPARFEGRAVPTAYDLSIGFYPENPACSEVLAAYNYANELAEEGAELYNEGLIAEALAKLDEAIALFPVHANFRYLRGQIYLNENRLDEACADLKKVRDVLATSYVDELLPLICK